MWPKVGSVDGEVGLKDKLSREGSKSLAGSDWQRAVRHQVQCRPSGFVKQ